MSGLTRTDFDRLPDTFTLKTARKDLAWQGTDKGLAFVLHDNGFAKKRTRHGGVLWLRLESASNHRARQAQTAWQKAHDQILSYLSQAREHAALATRAPADRGCACQCHDNTCGAAAMDMAERILRLIASLRPTSADMIEQLSTLVERAGPTHARAALKNFSPDDGVPF